VKAAFLKQRTGYEGLVTGDLDNPTAGPGQVLIGVHATAVTPTEFEWFPTFSAADGRPRAFPIILSHEFSGVVAAAGQDVTHLKVGDFVYGLNDWFQNGAQAEFCVAPAEAVGLKPRSLDHVQSAVVPLSALTAWQGLFDHGKLNPGNRVLIHGAAGGVGVFAVQLARWRGAKVCATASAKNLDFVRELGADEVVDYKTGRFEDVARDMDLVFDAAGGDTLSRSWAVLRPGGRMVTIAAGEEATNDQRTKDAFFIVQPNRTQLAEIALLLDAGKMRPFVEGVYRLNEVRTAFERAARGGMRGKVALNLET